MLNVDEPIRHVQLSPARADRLRAMSPQERPVLGADLTDTALYFARRGGQRAWISRKA